jgi:hypothetical protein
MEKEVKMTEKQDTQDKVVEAEVKPEADDQKPEPEAKPSAEELTQKIEELTGEVEKGKAHIKTLQGSLKAAQQRGMSKEDIDSLRNEIAGTKKWTAKMMDELANRISGDYEESKPSRKSFSQQLEDEEKAQNKPEPKKETDPDTEKFIKYMVSQDLDFEDSLVQEAIKVDEDNFRPPLEALKYLREKVEEKKQVEIDKRVDEKLQSYKEQWMKEFGLTALGVDGPSAPAKDLSGMTPDEKLQEGFKEYQKKK